MSLKMPDYMIFSALLLALLVFHPLTAAAAPCESLTSLSLPNTTITLAENVAPGQFSPPAGTRAAPVFKELPAFCRITATLKPSSDSNIQIEVWLPAAGWNGMFQPAGNGGWAGSINLTELANFVRAGFAAAGTDTGHEGFTGSFLIGHPEKAKDYGYRAFHEMTVAAKAMIAAYYGNGPKLSLINQSGGGGRQALSEAQRYPADYDAIAVPGTLDVQKTAYHFGQMWVYQAAHKDPASYIPPEKYPAIHQLALSKCDALVDGVADGIIDNPASCRIDPKEIECKGAGVANCLTPAQVEAARTIYTPVTNPRTKEIIYHPLLPGSELGWGSQAGPEPFPNALEFFKWAVYQDPNWDYKTRLVNFDSDVATAHRPEMVAVMNATDPDLSGFVNRGGKLLIVGGWADTGTAPGGSVDYYTAVLAKMGERQVRDSVRLFMVPGMGHSMGTSGPTAFNFDSIKVLLEWKQSGKAPDQLVANRYQNGKPVGTRLLCAYPQVAVYNGTGSAFDAASFACKMPK